MDDGQVPLSGMGRVGGAHASLIEVLIIHKLKRQVVTSFLHLGVPRGPHGSSMYV
ncbi:hypothetical protein HanHA89_Chr16g0681291 [Helianthus annuus]|nr:hypothetical protein HanHA89_Chr16g0681291 [Helianthus annuus]